MPIELAQVVAQLVEAISLLGEIEGSEDGAMDLARSPTADLRAAVEENLEQAHDARLMDLEAGITDGADGDRAGQALKEGKVDVAVEPFGLITGEAVGDRLESGVAGITRFPRCRVGGGALGCPRADLRPPLKRNVRFSRFPLSWMGLRGLERRYQ